MAKESTTPITLRCGRTWGHSGLCYPLHWPTQLSLETWENHLEPASVPGLRSSSQPWEDASQKWAGSNSLWWCLCALSFLKCECGGWWTSCASLPRLSGILPKFWTCSGAEVHLVIGTGVKRLVLCFSYTPGSTIVWPLSPSALSPPPPSPFSYARWPQGITRQLSKGSDLPLNAWAGWEW